MSSHGGHIGWRPEKPKTIFIEAHPMKIPLKFGLNWLSSFRGVDENVKSLRRRGRTQSDEKSSRELKNVFLKII